MSRGRQMGQVEAALNKATDSLNGLYLYKGFDKTPSLEIRHTMLPGVPEYDGGLPGISFRWLKRRDRRHWFYPCKSAEDFFADMRFRNLEKA